VDHFGISIKNDLCPITFEDTMGHYKIQLYLPAGECKLKIAAYIYVDSGYVV
jgi:hypothetical protein